MRREEVALMPPHNSPRWRAEHEGRDDPLATAIARRRALRGCFWQVGCEAWRALDNLAETVANYTEPVGHPDSFALEPGLIAQLFGVPRRPAWRWSDLARIEAARVRLRRVCPTDEAYRAALDRARILDERMGCGPAEATDATRESILAGGAVALTASDIVAEADRLRIELGPLDGQSRRRRELLAPFFPSIGGRRGTTSDPDDRRAYESVNLIDEPPVEAVDAPPVGLSASTRSFLAGLGDGG